MWHQKPSSLQSQTRITILRPQDFLSPAEQENTRDLSELLGLQLVNNGELNPSNNRTAKLGELSNSKTITEAVCVVPYVETRNGPVYISVPEIELYQAVRELGFVNYQKDYIEAYNLLSGQIQLAGTNQELIEQLRPDEQPRPIINQMATAMLNYVIPPEFNSIKYNGSKFADYRKVSPVLMFFFPFQHTFDRDDLAKIWQGVTPKIGENLPRSLGFKGNADNPIGAAGNNVGVNGSSFLSCSNAWSPASTGGPKALALLYIGKSVFFFIVSSLILIL